MAEANCRARGTRHILLGTVPARVTARFVYAQYPRESQYIFLCTVYRAAFFWRGCTQHIFLYTLPARVSAHFVYAQCTARHFFGAGAHGIFIYARYPRESRHIFLRTVPARVTAYFSMHSAPRGILFGAGAHGIFYQTHCISGRTRHFYLYTLPARVTAHFSMPRPAPHHLTHQSRQSRLCRCQEYRESECHRV